MLTGVSLRPKTRLFKLKFFYPSACIGNLKITGRLDSDGLNASRSSGLQDSMDSDDAPARWTNQLSGKILSASSF